MNRVNRVESGVMALVHAINNVRKYEGERTFDTNRADRLTINNGGSTHVVNNSIYPSEDLFDLSKQLIAPRHEDIHLREFLPNEMFDRGSQMVGYDTIVEYDQNAQENENQDDDYVEDINLTYERIKEPGARFRVRVKITRDENLQMQLANKRNYAPFIDLMRKKIDLATLNLTKKEQDAALNGSKGKVTGWFADSNFGSGADKSITRDSQTVNFLTSDGDDILGVISSARSDLDPNYKPNCILMDFNVLRKLQSRMIAINDSRTIAEWLVDVYKRTEKLDLSIYPVSGLGGDVYMFEKSLDCTSLATIENVTLLPPYTNGAGDISQILTLKTGGVLRKRPKSVVKITNVTT